MTNHTKPSREFLIDAIPAQAGRWHGVFAYPGRIPEIVQDRDDGGPLPYNSKTTALSGAGQLLCYILNDRLIPERRLRFTHMHGGDFAVALDASGLTVAEFAKVYGTTTDKIHAWIDGTKEVPFPMWLIMAVLKTPGGRGLARQIVEQYVDMRHPTTAPRSTEGHRLDRLE